MDPYSSPRQIGRKPAAYEQKPHSMVGIASFILPFLAFLIMAGCMGFIFYSDGANNGEIDDESPTAILIGFGILASFGVALIGVVLGIVACFQANHQRLFGIIGLIFNIMFIVGFCGLALIGLTIDA